MWDKKKAEMVVWNYECLHFLLFTSVFVVAAVVVLFPFLNWSMFFVLELMKLANSNLLWKGKKCDGIIEVTGCSCICILKTSVIWKWLNFHSIFIYSEIKIKKTYKSACYYCN